jgi:hypothetical protein
VHVVWVGEDGGVGGERITSNSVMREQRWRGMLALARVTLANQHHGSGRTDVGQPMLQATSRRRDRHRGAPAVTTI